MAEMTTILFFGDVVGRPGRNGLRAILPSWRAEHRPDLIVANVENLAHGYGVTESTIQEIIELGVDLCTSGNHIFDRKEHADRLLSAEDSNVLRPQNFGGAFAGSGVKIVQLGQKVIRVVNLQGRVFMPQEVEDPFATLETILSQDAATPVLPTLVDFHAEATSEKVALARAFDGRVSAVLGTHTHVPTADARVLRGGTGYQSDVGMCGALESVIGMREQEVLERFRTGAQVPLQPAEGPVVVNATLVTIDAETGHSTKIQCLTHIVPI